jgi:hypothetical protein
MILISHRGNLNGLFPDKENSPQYIDNAISNGFEVEIDLRTSNSKLFLGHDYAQYEITIEWLQSRRDNLWIHTKDSESLFKLCDTNLRYFFHEKESHTIIANSNLIWSHDLSEASDKSIIPLLSMDDILNKGYSSVHGICSDFISLLK